ncbi:hypothetical protein TEQG_00699 [Trichophyton equinum CBS 127.97]|uniref:Uncharacterized protein n=1 Tax=Trichophyton equinum (strain ATCC MYA-4606 / CBS 127.97) TaxID=559882 RepID=F2PI91_TRIEC|nr:hypothetical protein TEQG_00699 [Trichophyton equinum CBS 127.97]
MLSGNSPARHSHQRNLGEDSNGRNTEQQQEIASIASQGRTGAERYRMRNRETAGLVLCLVCSRTGRSQRSREERRGALDGRRRLRRDGDGDGELWTEEEEEEGEGKGEEEDGRSVNRRKMQGTASPLFSFLF